jgi:catechol 2,3-dioxygenase-like lactoylglutathione lyase family enzyme
MFNGTEHSAIASPDTRRLAEWCRDVLEFRIVRASGSKVFLRGRNDALLEILPSVGERQPGSSDPGICHLAIAVDDFDAALAALQAAKVTLLSEPRPGAGNRMVFFEGLDSNILHLIFRQQPMPG